MDLILYTITNSEARKDEAGRRKIIFLPSCNQWKITTLNSRIISLRVFLFSFYFPTLRYFSIHYFLILFRLYSIFSLFLYILFVIFPSSIQTNGITYVYVYVSVVLLLYSFTIVCRQDIKFPFTCLAGVSFIYVHTYISFAISQPVYV